MHYVDTFGKVNIAVHELPSKIFINTITLNTLLTLYIPPLDI